jgi:hypothetical protein
VWHWSRDSGLLPADVYLRHCLLAVLSSRYVFGGSNHHAHPVFGNASRRSHEQPSPARMGDEIWWVTRNTRRKEGMKHVGCTLCERACSIGVSSATRHDTTRREHIDATTFQTWLATRFFLMPVLTSLLKEERGSNHNDCMIHNKSKTD